MVTVAAVDCGATSVRVCRVDLDADQLVPEVVHRVAHAPVHDEQGHLRWDWDRIVSAVTDGLDAALAAGPLDAVGIDTWAVDYGLLDDAGQLIGAPYSYRDRRTDDYEDIVDDVGAEALYAINGLQLQPFNTIFQLARHDPDELARAARLLWLPELLVHALSGVAVTERTSAGSSGLVDLTTGDWSPSLLDIAGVDRSQLGEITGAGRIVGEWCGIPVALVGGHDTASAVVGMGPASPDGSAFVASGTWMLAGIEREEPDTSKWARTRNFTNEAGALGGFRFLRNVSGFWLLEQCRQAWGDPPIEELVHAATTVTDEVALIDVDDETLRAPEDMLTAVTAAAGISRDAAPGVVTRTIVEAIAARTADVIGQLAEIAPFDNVVLFGGAARMDLLVQRLAERSGRAVVVGSAEAAAVGNAIVQGVALGHFASIEDGRARTRESRVR